MGGSRCPLHKRVTQSRAADVGGVLLSQRPDVLSQRVQVRCLFRISRADSLKLTWAHDGAIWHRVHLKGIMPEEVRQVLPLLMSHLQRT